jgi:tRNA dimethylallyltransferase
MSLLQSKKPQKKNSNISILSAGKTVIIIAGPTASGKTSLAIRIAKELDTEIISADSRQCFKEMKIGVARPSAEELTSVPHWFIASHSVHDKVTAATFEEFAIEKTNEIFQQKDVLVMVGGTGLYLRAFTEGLHEIPPVPEHILDDITEQYYAYGLNWLQEEIRTMDPKYFEHGEIKNPHRLMRALSVIRATGRSIIDFREEHRTERPFRILKFAIELPREELKQRIDRRVDDMIKDGLVEEARALFPHQHLNALQTVGYKELFQYFRSEMSLPEAISHIKIHTKQYAKRQSTWFRNDGGYGWITPEGKFMDTGNDVLGEL